MNPWGGGCLLGCCFFFPHGGCGPTPLGWDHRGEVGWTHIDPVPKKMRMCQKSEKSRKLGQRRNRIKDAGIFSSNAQAGIFWLHQMSLGKEIHFAHTSVDDDAN